MYTLECNVEIVMIQICVTKEHSCRIIMYATTHFKAVGWIEALLADAIINNITERDAMPVCLVRDEFQ